MTWKHRHTILGILFCAWLLCYVDRMVMATAIPFIAQDLHLSPLVMGSVLSAFFAGYALMQIPGGLLADKFGPRAVLAASIGWWSVLTALTGMVPGLTAMLAVRVLFGLGEGPFPPSAAKAIATWFPRREVARANGLLLASTAIGATVAPLLVVALIKSWGWRSVFYSLFAPGVAVASVVWLYVKNSPAQSTLVTGQEMADYEADAVRPVSVRASLRESLRTRAVLWCALSMFFSNVVAWGLMNWLPTYLLQARGFGMEKMGAFAALTNLAGALGYPVGGYISDRYFKQELRIPIVLGFVISGVFTYLAALAPSGELACIYLLLVFFSINAASTAINTLPMLAVPKHAVGGAYGIVNTAGQLAGLLSPLLIGYVLNITHSNFEVVFYCLVGLCFIALYPALRIKQPASLSTSMLS